MVVPVFFGPAYLQLDCREDSAVASRQSMVQIQRKILPAENRVFMGRRGLLTNQKPLKILLDDRDYIDRSLQSKLNSKESKHTPTLPPSLFALLSLWWFLLTIDDYIKVSVNN